MGCKNCKSKKLQTSFNGVTDSLQHNINTQKKKLIDDNVDMTQGLFNNRMKILITLFGWVPLIIGYITIIRFFIYLF